MNQRLAEGLRALAEQYNDPHLYEIAAAEFIARGQTCAAAACRDRAKHYREINNANTVDELSRVQFPDYSLV